MVTVRYCTWFKAQQDHICQREVLGGGGISHITAFDIVHGRVHTQLIMQYSRLYLPEL
jgi:hypothetical protein